MTVGEAKAIGRQWALEHTVEVPGLHGVFLGGTIKWLADESEFDPLSDIDLCYVIKGYRKPPLPQRKFMHKGVVLEASYWHMYEHFSDAKTVLGNWKEAAHFSVPCVIVDTTGCLRAVQQEVAAHYREREWVRRRCENMQLEAQGRVGAVRTAVGRDEALEAFFRLGVIASQIPVVASLLPPTVRKAPIRFAEVMRARGQDSLVEMMQEFNGTARLSMVDVERLLQEATAAYDRALEVHQRPVRFDYQLCPASRLYMIDGGQNLIDCGDHRFAGIWICYTHWIAAMALEQETPAEYVRTWREPLERALAELGIGSLDALSRKADLGEKLLARMMAVADEIISAGSPR